MDIDTAKQIIAKFNRECFVRRMQAAIETIQAQPDAEACDDANLARIVAGIVGLEAEVSDDDSGCFVDERNTDELQDAFEMLFEF